MGPHMSFALDRYEPVAFHTHPELMRAAEAQTAVLQPSTAPMPPPGPAFGTAPAVAPAPVSSPPRPVSSPPSVGAPTAAVPVAEVTAVSLPTPAAPAPPPAALPIAAYLIGMNATPLLRSSLADFLDAAGSRRDARVSVGVATGGQVCWVLRDQVPYGVRALPTYPDVGPAPDSAAALAAAAATVVADAADVPGRRQLVVLLGDRPPETAALPAPLRSALVLHCVDAVLSPPASTAARGNVWVLARSRPGRLPSLLGHAGRLLDTWEPFVAVPPGLVLFPVGGDDRP